MLSVQVAPFAGVCVYPSLATPEGIDVPSEQDIDHETSLA